MKTAEEFIREKIRQNHTVPMSFLLSRIDFLNGEEAMVWAKEYSDLTNAKLVESLEYLRSCYDLELLNKAKLKETNTKLVEENEVIKATEQIWSKANKSLEHQLSKLKEENERLKQSISRHETDYSDLQNRNIYLREKLSEHKHDIESLQSELSAAKERVLELEKNARQLCTLLAKDQILFFLSQGEKDGIMDILKTLTPKQHG